MAIAVNPVTNKIYVANIGDVPSVSTVTVIDGSSDVTAKVPAVAFPDGMAVNPVTNKVYVASWGGGGSDVIVIDGTSNADTAVATDLWNNPDADGGEPGNQQDLRGRRRQQHRNGYQRGDQ
jgi:DNA-binding beta-propeller fold protein YncE